jgi:hypothetical protein
LDLPACARPARPALVNLNRVHLELFLLTKLAIAFEFFDDEQDAVNSYFPDRKLKRFDILTFVQQEAGQFWRKALE